MPTPSSKRISVQYQFTPPSSEASIIFGKGVTSAPPGSIDSLVLAVYDIDAARDNLIALGVNVSEVFHYAGGPLNSAVENPRVSGRDPEGRSYFSFASFEDPDGNGWLLQEIRTRFPGREWNLTRPQAMDVATLAGLLRETAEHHDIFEKTHAEHHWYDWVRTLSERTSERQQSRGGKYQPLIATWKRSFTFLPDDVVRVTVPFIELTRFN